jgi:hypothetical protein
VGGPGSGKASVCKGEREPLKAGSSAGAAGWLSKGSIYLLALALEAGRSAKLSVSGSR